MSLGAFSTTLSVLNRYDLKSDVAQIQLTALVIGIVSVSFAGHGIVAIALCELLAALVVKGLLVPLARKICAELRIRPRKPPREVLRKIWFNRIHALLLTVAVQLVHRSVNLVVGAFVSAPGVTFDSIGKSLCRYTQQFVGAMTTTFIPASTNEAQGHRVGVVKIVGNIRRVK